MGQNRIPVQDEDTQVQEGDHAAEIDLRRQNLYLTALQETALGLVGRLDLNDLLQTILARAGELVDTNNGYVFMLDPESNEMVMRVGVGEYENFVGTRAKRGFALAGKVWETGEAVVVDDYRHWSERLADPSRDVLRAVVGVPLKSRERVVGVLGLAHLEPEKRFGPVEMDLLNRFAALASVALDNAQLYDLAQRELAQRRATESRLAYERDLLQALMDNIPDLIFFKDRESRFVRSNNAHLKNLGATSMDQVFGKTDLDFHVDAPAHSFMEDEKRILETGVAIRNQVESNPTLDGTLRYFSTSKVPWRDPEGNIIGTLGVAHDITDRVLAEEKLTKEVADRQRAEQFLDSIVENLPTMLFVKEANELRFVRWNKAGELITGERREALLGKNDYELFPEEEADFFVKKDRQALSSGEAIDIPEEPIQSKDGTIRWLHTRKVPILDREGQPAYLLGISEDITERKQAEREARAGQERLTFQNALLGAQYEVSPDGILVVGTDDRLLSYNHRFLEMWNIPAEALKAGSAEPLRQAVVQNVADAEGWMRRTGEIYTQQEKSSHDELVFKDGRIFERYSTPIKTPDGRYTGRVWFFHDITESRRAEQDVRRVVEGARAVFWRASVTKLKDESLEAEGFHWETQYSNPNSVLQFIPIKMGPGQDFVDAWYNSWLEEDRVQMDHRSAEALRKGLPGYTQEYRVLDAEGKIRWMFEDAKIQVIDETHYEVVGFSNEITERKRDEETLQRQNAYLNALQETSLGLMQRLDVDTLLEDIVARAGALVGTENGYVFLTDPDFQEMELRVGVGAYEGFVGRRTKPGVGLAGLVWERNAPVIVDDYREWGGRLADASRDILRAVAGVPLRSGQSVVGVIGLAYLDETRKFGEAEVQVLQRFAQLATIALDNARSYQTAQRELVERTRAERELAKQLHETELLNRVTNHAVSLDIDNALIEICRDVATYFGMEQSGIALLSEDKQTLTVVADHSPPTMTSVVGFVIPVAGNPSTEIVLETRKPVAFADALTDERLAPIHDLMKARGVASILIAPLFMRDQIIGTIGIDSYQRYEFTARDIALVERVAVSISTALENARLYRAAQQELVERKRAEQEMRQRNTELEVISRMSAVMTHDVDTVTALETMARELVTLFKARNCGIALLNPDRQSLTVVADALSEEHEEHAVGIVIPVENNPSTQYVLNTRHSLVIPDAQTDPMTEPIHERMRQRRTKCLAIVPLLSGGDIIGTIGLDTTDPGHIFTDAEIRLAETMASQMANAIEKQRLYDQTRERALREQVTREIGANLNRSLDTDTIMQTMARESSQALGASHAVVRMGTEAIQSNGGNGHE